MATTNNTYTGNGSNKLFSITFPYLDTTDVDVYLNGVLQTIITQYTFANATTIEFVAAPANGVQVLIQRDTDNETAKAVFFAGSSVRASDLNDNFDQALYTRQELIDTSWNNTDDTITSVETWASNDSKIATTAATVNQMDVRHDTLVQTSTPAAGSYQLGKTWLQNDANKTLSIWNGTTWLGVASGGTFTTQPTVIYVDNVNGNDTNDGHRIINPKKTIKNAVASAAAGDIIKVAPGVYQETLPIDITVANLSIVGEAQRSCFVHPTPATETQIMFRCNSGTYIDGFTFAGLKASGSRGGNAIDNDATYGLPTNQGWVAGFYPGAIIRKSPYINNSTTYNDSGINNAAFDPNNYSGTGGDTTSAPTGGGIIVDGSLPDVTSPLRSFVINEFTQVCLDGPGLLVCNNGYAQAVSFFGLFCHYHAKALSGGQINMEVGTTDFGRYGLIADGKSSSAIFTATANGAASANAVTFAINAPTAGGTWFGDANRPAINMLAQVTVSGTTYTYPILNSTANGSGWNVTISRPNPSNRAENLGLNVAHANGATWSFFLRSMISTASHTMEYAGSGTNYNALPENGGVAVEANEAVNRNDGKVWLTSTDQSGKFKVGDTFAVDQQTGFVTIDPQSVSTNVVSDLTPELGGDLDVLTRNIYSSVGPIKFVTSSTERVRIDSSGRLLVGTSTPRSNFFGTTLSAVTQTEGTGGAAGRGSLSVINNDVSNNPPYVLLGRSGAATLGSNAAVVSGSRLGTLTFQGADGTNFVEAATVAGEIDGTPGANDMPGRLVFSTTADGAASPTERMRISQNGTITVGGGTSSSAHRLAVVQTTNTDNTTPTVYIERNEVAANGNSGMTVGLEVNMPNAINNSSTTGIKVYTGLALENTAYAIDAEVVKKNNGVTRAARFTGGHGNTEGYGAQNVVDIIAGVTGTGTNGRVRGLYIQNPNYNYTGGNGQDIGICLNDLTTAAVTHTAIEFQRDSSTVGTITTTLTATAYNTSSDYRLKENIVTLDSAIDRLISIPVHRFNFISNPDQVVDGFLAHEVALFVPEAITGQKDEVQISPKMDENNQPILDDAGQEVMEEKPVYQSIDQSKLVPLLTAALQEAIGRIESLETEVALLKN